MKLVAFYLPQFHEIEENNRAWGKGFTEWNNVKKAKPLYLGHNQPRVPLNNNYYNLLKKNTLKWQIDLARKYGVYGFCFYHYWFGNDKKVLEKPAEILLKNQDLDIPFCFAWANEPWTKTWHGASGEKEVLIEQHYGTEIDWKKHFEYFYDFFKDDRYIYIDGKPILLIYQINKIGCFNRMIEYWNKLAQERGIPGLFIIDMLTDDGKTSRNKRVSATVDFEPGKTRRERIRNQKWEGFLGIPDYEEECLAMLERKHGKNEYRCQFVDYDDTPRRAGNGIAYKGSTPDIFGKYLQKAIELSQKEGNEIVFINAWNEWGEGNYLEPDTCNKYGYLQAVERAINGKYESVTVDQNIVSNKSVSKHKKYYELCNRWIKNNNENYSISEYFKCNGYCNIAVYGMGELGNRLIEALSSTEVCIKYGIDKDIWVAFADISIKALDEEEKFEDIDCIVVTPIHAYEEIKKELGNKCECDIISLEDVIYGI